MQLFFSAGDVSGDNAAALLAKSLLSRYDSLALFGLGQSQLKALGQEQLADGADLAVLGFWEVARKYRFFKSLLERCTVEIEQRRPDAVILVDYPGFNLRLAKRIKHLGIPIIYYIAPQVWAWGERRLKDISRLVDLLLVILPFEESFFQKANVNARFVGHYLLEDIPAEYIASPVLESGSHRLCLMPGSRSQEIKRMLPSMLEAARRFNRTCGMTAVVAAIEGAFDYEKAVQPFREDGISVTYNDARNCLYESGFVLTASGTATLEAAIVGRPMVVVYKTGLITYQIARWLVNLNHIALVNLVLGEKTVPELIQNDATPERMMEALQLLHNNEDNYRTMTSSLNRVPQILGGKGSTDRAASLIAEQLNKGVRC